MRIAIVLDYSLDVIGGAQRAALNEAAALVAAGHRALLVGPVPVDRTVVPRGVDALWTTSRRLPGFDFPLAAADDALRERLLRHLRGARIDAVHVHSEFGHARAATDAARRLGLPVVHTVHTAYWPGVPAPLRPPTRRLLARLAGPVPRRTANPVLDHTVATALAADVVVSPSAHQAADLAEHGVEAVVLPNCDLAGTVPTRLPGGPLQIAWIGRCVPEKRLLAFVRAVALAQRLLPPERLRVAVAGDGPLLPVARALGSHTPGLHFLGRLEREGVRDLVAASHLTALTSHGFDNQPMTVVESIRAARGVIHTDPRLTEGLDRAGLLAASPEPAAIAALLVELALDRSRVEAAARGARETADLFAPERHVERLLPLLGGSPAFQTVA